MQNDIIERHPMASEMTRKYNCRIRIARYFYIFKIFLKNFILLLI